MAAAPLLAQPSRAAIGLSALRALCSRDIKRFLRQPSRIVGGIGAAALVWILLGGGFAGSFLPAARTVGSASLAYAAYLVPGMATMIVLFASIVAAISLIEDRHAGFLQSVLVSPAPAWSVVAGKLLATAIVATAQAALVLVGALLLGVMLTPLGFLGALAALFCISVGIGGIGLALAWRIDSVQGFHGVMNLVLMPMWLLSGAFFPVASAAVWLGTLMYANPLTWASEALRLAVNGHTAVPTALAIAGAPAFAALGAGLAWAAMLRAVRTGGAGGANGGVRGGRGGRRGRRASTVAALANDAG